MTPAVLCVMPADGRLAMVERAVRCFHAQTYPNKRLAILDSGSAPLYLPMHLQASGRYISIARVDPGKSIGELRNLINSLSSPNAFDAEIIAHWDSDDWSHPERLTEQVALLNACGAPAVGYTEMLFWKTRPRSTSAISAMLPDAAMRQGEAWLYSQANPRQVLGTSLCYWRRTWEKTAFPAVQTGEDHLWLLKVKAHGLISIVKGEPRMVASIHGSNTCSKIIPGAKEWTRVQGMDKWCEETMAL
jgi:hypothetical protein